MTEHDLDAKIVAEGAMSELTTAELQAVAGGINPQPLPPIVERNRD